MNSEIELIKYHEGLRLKVYTDTVGTLTIGYGRNLEDRGISQGEADWLLRADIASARKALAAKLSAFDTLDTVRRAVLVDMTFNLGIDGLLGFVRMLSALESGDYVTAALEMRDSKWSTQVGQRAVRLSKMMSTGVWP